MKQRKRHPLAKYRALRHWHKWFAWYPVQVTTDGHKQMRVWLETIERRIFDNPLIPFSPLPDAYYTLTKEYRFLKRRQIQMRNKCPTCQGTGTTRKWKLFVTGKCKDCNGTGYMSPPVKPTPPPSPPPPQEGALYKIATTDLIHAMRLIIGRQTNTPFFRVPDSEIMAYVIQCKKLVEEYGKLNKL